MSVKLDWDIDNEQGKHNSYKEDKNSRKARYKPLLTLLFSIVIFLSIVAGVVYALYWRWEQVNEYVEALLVDTVQAEVAALRIGDFDSFINVQRSASDDWYRQQQVIFQDYQTLKVDNDVSLVGEVVSVEVDGQRGRVQVQEIIDGTPYIQTWFYWRYDTGWAHVPPDYTFWGEERVTQQEYFSITYQAVDEPTANGVQASLTRWFDDACGIFDCLNLDPVQVEIVTDDIANATWRDDAEVLLISTPFRERARADRPFNRQYQVDTATLVANYIIDYATQSDAAYPADAHFLRSSVVAWLVGRFAEVNPQTPLIESLVANYGTESIPDLLQNLQPNSSIGVLSDLSSIPFLSEATLDWRDFVVWRISLESDLIQRGDEATWLNLYDLTNSTVSNAAYARYTASASVDNIQVLDIQMSTADDGTPQLVTQVQMIRNDTLVQETIVFKLVNNNWLRAS